MKRKTGDLFPTFSNFLTYLPLLSCKDGKRETEVFVETVFVKKETRDRGYLYRRVVPESRVTYLDQIKKKVTSPSPSKDDND